QKLGTSLPTGVSSPMPVTTTRRSPSRIGHPSGNLLVTRNDDAQDRLDGGLAIDAGDRPDPAEHPAQLLDRHLQAQRVAGDDQATEAALVDASEEADLAAVFVER